MRDDISGPVLEVRIAVRPWGGSHWPGTLELSEAIPLNPPQGGTPFSHAVTTISRINELLEQFRRENLRQ